MASYDNKVVTGAGVSALKTWVDNRISNLAGGASAPVGSIMAYAGEGTPFGWLLCDGSAVSRATFSDLFASIGTMYGAGDGTTTFNLPNLLGRFLEGASVAGETKDAGVPEIYGRWNRGSTSENTTFSTTSANNGAFSAGGASGSRRHFGNSSSNQSGYVYLDFKASLGETKMDGTRQNDVYGKSDTVQPPAITVRYIIKA